MTGPRAGVASLWVWARLERQEVLKLHVAGTHFNNETCGRFAWPVLIEQQVDLFTVAARKPHTRVLGFCSVIAALMFRLP